jgi:hypothetical protein
MSDKHNDGGPAFPVVGTVGPIGRMTEGWFNVPAALVAKWMRLQADRLVGSAPAVEPAPPRRRRHPRAT